MLFGDHQIRVLQILVRDHFPVFVQNNRYGDVGVNILHGIVADICINGINSVVYFKRGIRCQLLAVVSCEQACEADKAVIVVNVRFLGFINPCAGIYRKTIFRNFGTCKEFSYVNCLSDCKNTLVDIRIFFCGDRYFIAYSALVERIFVERQLDGLAASRKRNIGVVVKNYLNITRAVALAQNLHAGDADIRTVQNQRAAVEYRAAARDHVSGIAYRALGDVVCHEQCCGLIRVQVYCEVFALGADLRSDR